MIRGEIILTEYVAGFMKDKSDKLILVRKNKPVWQEGKLNGVGGKVEVGETPRYAMYREWAEETGHEQKEWSLFSILKFKGDTIYFYKATVDALPVVFETNDIGEKIEIHSYYSVGSYLHSQIIPNLKWLLPLAFEDAETVVIARPANDNILDLKVAA